MEQAGGYESVGQEQPEDVLARGAAEADAVGPLTQAPQQDGRSLPSMDDWQMAQKWEGMWWRDPAHGYSNSYHEEWKQWEVYRPRMGLDGDSWYSIDLGGRSVIDVGGGPISMLLKCRNGGRRLVVDPLSDTWPDWVHERYRLAGIEVKCGAGEELDESGFDEVWVYNVLQHVRDPAQVVRCAMRAAQVLRIFEWINTPISDGHIHTLTEEMLDGVIGHKGKAETLSWSSQLQSFCYYGIFDCPSRAQMSVAARIPGRSGAMRFHVPGLAHTVTTPEAPWNSCAYSQKVRKLCSMLTNLGYEVYHYGGEGAQVECTEHVEVISRKERLQYYPHGEDMGRQFTYDTSDALHARFNARSAQAIKDRLEGGRNFLLCSWGWGHQPIAAHLAGLPIIVVEPGVGYSDTFAPYRVFESSAWMHYVYGIERGIRQHRPATWNLTLAEGGQPGDMVVQIPDNGVTAAARGRADTGSFYDAVIPNYFVPDEFQFQEEKEDWILYLGRMVQRKGVETAVEATAAAGVRLVLAGQGSLTLDTGATLQGDHIEFVGHANPEMRANLMARAKALICPTYYIGPFEGVAVESMMSGTPVISTDFGAFQETVLNGITGYRCHTLEQFVWAINNVGSLSPFACRQWAIDNFSVDRVAPMFQEYFEMVDRLRDTKGWPEPNPGRTQLDWLTKKFPEAG